MELALTPEQERFRTEVRDYFEALLTPEIRSKMGQIGNNTGESAELRNQVIRQMGKDGWLGVGWPKEFGGRDLTPIEQFICFDESMRAGGFVTPLNTLGPSLMEFGTDEQRAFFLPKMLAGEIQICIGYSEPGAGTDLASLKTRAVRDGDEYVINGQKTWTSLAQVADYVWLATRTDPDVPKHKGITLFLIPMDTPGIKVVPIDIMGEADINQVFYDDVRVPASMRVGDENQGWSIITGQLNHERIVLCSSGIVERALLEVRQWAQATRRADGTRVVDDEWVQLNLARVHAKLEFLRLLNFKIAWAESRRGAPTGGCVGDEGLRVRALSRVVPSPDGDRRASGVPHRRRAGGGAARAPRALLPRASHRDVRGRHGRGAARSHRDVRARDAAGDEVDGPLRSPAPTRDLRPAEPRSPRSR